MKRTLLLLSACLVATVLPGCLTLTSEFALPDNGEPGALSGRIKSTWTWPLVKPAEPALPVDAGAPGKNPVLTPP